MGRVTTCGGGVLLFLFVFRALCPMPTESGLSLHLWTSAERLPRSFYIPCTMYTSVVSRSVLYASCQACTVLERCRQSTADVELSAQLTLAIDLVTQSIELLTRCPNIYTTHMDKDLRMQVRQQVLTSSIAHVKTGRRAGKRAGVGRKRTECIYGSSVFFLYMYRRSSLSCVRGGDVCTRVQLVEFLQADEAAYSFLPQGCIRVFTNA